MNEIKLIYCPDDAIVGSFWYYFFRMCGIWCERIVCMDTNDEISRFTDEIICVVSEHRSDIIRYKLRHNRVIHIDREKNLKCLSDYERRTLSGNMKDIVLSVFGSEESIEAEKLLHMYLKNKLYYVLWTFHEMPKPYEPTELAIRKYKTDLITSFLKESGGGRYERYARIYLNYIKIAENKDPKFNNKKSHKLLEKCEEFINDYPDVSSGYYLAGRICELDLLDKWIKWEYYKKLLSFNGGISQQIFCEKELEKTQISGINRFEFYQKLLINNESDFRIHYELALCEKERGRYFAALDHLYTTIDLLEPFMEHITRWIEVRYMENALWELSMLYLDGFNNRRFLERYAVEKKHLEENIGKSVFFKEMLKSSFGDQETFVKRIMDALTNNR